jgi:fructoselysine 6-kinase
VSTRPGATARQDILLAPGGERIFPPGGYTLGVLDGFRLDDAAAEFVSGHDVIACALFTQLEPLFAQVLALPSEARRVADFLDLSDYGCDPGIVERYAEQLTIAFVSGDRALAERLRPLARATRCQIVVTLGAEGSLALVRGEPLYQPAAPVSHVVDTTGCGDAFQAAFTVAYLRTGDTARALRAGAEQAALVTQHLGAFEQEIIPPQRREDAKKE